MTNAFKTMNNDKLAVVKAAAEAAGAQQLTVNVEGEQKWLSTKPLVGLGVGVALGALGMVAYNKFSKS